MTSFTTKTILTAVIGAFLALSGNTLAAQASKPAATDKKTATAATTAPTAQEISDAKAKGLVWVNTSTKVYHKDGQFYGTTKKGKFMTEADAQKQGYRGPRHRGPVKRPPAMLLKSELRVLQTKRFGLKMAFSTAHHQEA
jgi:hypothetical protein